MSLIKAERKYKDTHVKILTDKRKYVDIAMHEILNQRTSLELYIEENPKLLSALKPIKLENPPEIVKLMAEGASIAGVGIASMTVMAITSARMGLAMGTRAIVARFIGADDRAGANHVAQQAFVISGTYVVVIASLGMFLAEPIMTLFGVEADVVTEGAAYMRIMFVGSIAMSFRMLAGDHPAKSVE